MTEASIYSDPFRLRTVSAHSDTDTILTQYTDSPTVLSSISLTDRKQINDMHEPYRCCNGC